MNEKEMKKNFNKIVKDIKEIKIQGARNVAREAVKAYFLMPSKKSKKILLSSRSTEPMMENFLEFAEKGKPFNEIISHFDFSQNRINKQVFKLIKNNSVVFTHCHSTNVSDALVFSKNKGKKFEVYLTETRPLFQGRKTAKKLKKAGIKVNLFVDSAMGIALSKEQGTKKVDIIFLGSDALTKKGIINKVGSETIAKLAKIDKIPFYIVADSWKFTKKKVPIEQRNLYEVWDNAPKKIKVSNPAFEFVPKKYITGIITELGLMKYDSFLEKMNKRKN